VAAGKVESIVLLLQATHHVASFQGLTISIANLAASVSWRNSPRRFPSYALYLSKVEKEQVHEALEQLSEEFREIILLREFAELSYQEIATVLGCAQGTVMSRLARARQKLRTLLHPDDKPFQGAIDFEALIV